MHTYIYYNPIGSSLVLSLLIWIIVFDATLQVQMIESSPWEQTEFHHRKINVLLNVPSGKQK
jgi:hypothetical protein